MVNITWVPPIMGAQKCQNLNNGKNIFFTVFQKIVTPYIPGASNDSFGKLEIKSKNAQLDLQKKYF